MALKEKTEKKTRLASIAKASLGPDADPRRVTKTDKKSKKDLKPTASIGTINVTGKPAELIKKYQRNNSDTGSTEVQIALFTAKIDQLSKHLKKHAKDSDSKRGLLIMVGKRRRLLTFLQKTDTKRYDNLVTDLGLRK